MDLEESGKGKKLEDCCRYVRENPILGRLLTGFREKYASLGVIGGSVALSGISRDDTEALEGFFGKSFHGRTHVSISALAFRKALKSSRFSDIVPEELLAYYFKGNLKSKKEMRQEEEAERKVLFEQVRKDVLATPAADWLERIQAERSSPYQMVIRCYQADPKAAQELLCAAAAALNRLPVYQERFEYLAVFSAKVTGNPHYFDEGNEANKLLSSGIQMILGQQETAPGNDVFPAFMKQKLFLSAGILKDDISNYTVAYGFHACKMDGGIHDGIEGYWHCQESMHLSLQTVAGLSRVFCEENAIYVFENPSVYAVLTGMAGQGKCLLCMNGQPNMAAILLLDLFVAAKTVIYYAGDFDPEGLWIAQRLKLRYRDQLRFMAMKPTYYEHVISQTPIEEKRLKVLERLEDGELIAVGQCIKEKRRAGYQEGLITDYCEILQLDKNHNKDLR